MGDERKPSSPKTRRRGGLFRHRDFRLLWLGETVSMLGNNVTTVALPLVAVVALRATTFEAGLVTAMVWLPWLILGLPAGAWLERRHRKPVMVACDVVAAVLFLSVPVAAWLGLLGIGQLLVVAFGTGGVNVVFSTAYRGYLPALVENPDLPEANAKLQGSESATQIGGRAVAGGLTQAFGAVAGLLVDAVSFLVSAACLLLIRTTEPAIPASTASRRLLAEIWEGVRWVARDPYLRAFAAFGAVGNIALTGYEAVQVVFLVRVLGVSPAVVGGVIALTGFGGVLASVLVTPLIRRAGTARGVILILACTGPFGLLIPLAFGGAGVVLAAAGTAGLGIGIVVTNVISAGFRQSYPPPPVRTRVIATGGLLINGTGVLGAVLAGLLGTLLGVRPTVWIMVGVFLVAVLMVVASPIREARDLPGTATGPGLRRCC